MSHPHAPAEVLRSGYAVQFLSCFSGFACFEAITGARDGILRSTTTATHVAFWPTREAALAWLDAMGFAENDAVPVGIGHMTCGVRPFSADLVDPEWCRGSLFEVPKGWKPAPAAAAPQKTAAEVRSERFRSLLRQARERRAAAKAAAVSPEPQPAARVQLSLF